MSSKSWVGAAFGAAGRFTRRMRDEWKAGEAESGQPLETEVDRKTTPKSRQVPAVEQWWDALRVGPAASKDEIRQAWRRLIKENHPDKGGHLSSETQAAMEQMAKRLNDAYEKAMKRRDVD